MIERVPGELVALAQVTDDADEMRLLAVVSGKNGVTVGVLAGPPNGTEGAVGFVPVPALHALATEIPELEVLLEAAAPVGAGPDPDDPRGLRPATRERRPGMTS